MSLLLLLSGGSASVAPLSLPAGALYVIGTTAISGYTGDLAVVERSSDSATANIGAGSNFMIDEAAIISFASGSPVGFRKPIDQSGNNYDFTQATFASMPYYDADRKRRNLVGMSFLGSSTIPIDATVSLDRQSCTVITVHAPQMCPDEAALFQIGTGTTNRIGTRPTCRGAGGVGGAQITNGTSINRPQIGHPSQPCVEVLISSPSSQRLRINGREGATLAATTSVTCTGGKIGNSDTVGYPYYGNIYFQAVYNSVLSDADIISVENQLKTLYSLWFSPSAYIIGEGDSIRNGYLGGGVPGTEYMEDNYFTTQVELRNMGITGQSLATMFTQFETNILSAYRPTLPCIFLGRGGNNDIAAGTNPTTLYNSTLTPYAALADRAGYDYLVFEDSQARTFDGTTVGQVTGQANRLTWNTAIDGNAAGFDAIVKNSLTFDDYTDATLYNADETHFTDAGYELHGDIIWNEAIQTALSQGIKSVPALTADPAAIGSVRMFLNINNDSLTNVVRTPANRVSSILDSSGNSYTASRFTAGTEPAYYKRGLNGRPAMRFNGGNGIQLNDSLLTLIGVGANTIIFPFQAEATGAATQYLIGGFTSSSGWRWGITISSTTIQFQNRNSSSSATSYAYAWNTNTHIICMRRTGTTVELILDGVQVASATNGENTSLSGGRLMLGANNTVSGNQYTGWMGIPVSFSKYCSNAELNTLGGAMATDYGATWTGL